MTGKPLRTNADFPEQQVAVVVFATVRAVDAADATGLVESAVRKAFRDVPGDYVEPHSKTIFFQQGNWQVPVLINSVREVTQAALGGYLAVQPTGKGYPEAPR